MSTAVVPNLVTFTINGKQVQAAPQARYADRGCQTGRGWKSRPFVITKACRLQAACRMCLVEDGKNAEASCPACTLVPLGEGMVDPHRIAQRSSRRVKPPWNSCSPTIRSIVPLCDKGGECELQDMVFKYGAGREPLHRG